MNKSAHWGGRLQKICETCKFTCSKILYLSSSVSCAVQVVVGFFQGSLCFLYGLFRCF